MTTRYDERMRTLHEAAQPERDAPSEFARYLDKVRLHAYRVTDEDVAELEAAGFSEDEIFEQTVSAATAAGFERLTAALGTLE